MFACLAGSLWAGEPVRIGVLAFRPKPRTLAQWRPLEALLKRALPERDFVVEALTYPEMDQAVASRRVQFILTNPGHYVMLKAGAGLPSPLATLAMDEGGTRTTSFGGVIFTSAGRGPEALGDLRGRTIAFPDTESLGGYQMQAFELARAGVRLPRDARLLPTGMPHDNVVEAVLSGRAEAGFVRSGILEGMAREGKLDPARIRVLDAGGHGPYPALVSTRLYPEWPFTALPGTEEQVARRVAAALFLLEDHSPEARAMGIRGFATPADYAPVEDILRELRLPPFQAPPRFTLPDVWARYRWPLLTALLALAVVGSLGIRLKLAHRRLEESEIRNRALVTAIPDLIFRCSRDGEVLFAHAPDGGRVLAAAEDILHRKAADILPGPDARRALAAFGAALDEGTMQELDFSVQAQDGPRHFEARIMPTTRDQVIAIVRDVTDRMAAQEERRLLENQLLQAQKMESLGVMAGGVAHDMNNVLAAILGLASANVEVASPGSLAHDSFSTIVKAAERGGTLVKGLLTFARTTPSEGRPLDVNALIRDELRLLERTTFATVSPALELAQDLLPIRGEAGALSHALMNLCVNAVDAMPGGGALTLRTRNAEGWVEVEVEDSGTGMSRDVLERAMDPFFTTKAPGKGTGLGLAMVYATVRAHQGTLTLESEPGRGTVARMRFPASRALPPPAPTPRERPRGPLNILLVDDDPLVQASTGALLAVLGHSVACSACGEEALAALETGSGPDLVILDLNMPGLGGAATLPLLRARHPGLPVLLATGRADQAALDLAAAHPGVSLISKPFSLEDLRGQLQ